jgi:hypothetical protein
MPRGLSTEIKAAIAAGTVHPVYLAYFDFDGGAVRTWTGEGDLSYDSETWSGDGTVTSWPNITESVDLVANNITVELSGNASYAVDIADPDVYRARTCEIYIGFVAADGSLPSTNVYKVFSGRMAVVGFIEDGEADGYSITVESRLVDLQKAKTVRYTHQSQLQRYPGGDVLSSGSLTVGELYEVTDAGTGADFSAAGGPASPSLNDRFVATGTSVTWGSPAAELTSLPDMGLEYAGAAQDALFLSRGEKPDKPFSRKAIYGTTVVDGSVVFVATSGTGSRYLNLVIAFADHECDDIEQLYLDDRAVLSGGSVAGEFVDVVEYYERLGTANQAYISELETEVGSTVWDERCRLRGVCYVYVRILYSEELFGTDAPAVSARIRGKKLYDPRTTSTAFSDNAALAVRDYLLSENYGFSGGSADVDDATVSVAANDCDYLVTKADASTEKRYTVNGVLDTALPIGENLKLLLDAMAGKVSYLGGVFSLYAGAYSLTSLVVADGDLVDEINFRNRNLREAYNGARGLYRTPALDWQEEDYPAYQNASALAADGESRWMDLPLPLTTSAARCQRIAKIAVMRSRAARMVSLATLLSKLELRAGDVISVNTEKSQIGSVVYEIRSLSIVLAFEPRIDLELLEVAASDYAWDESTEETELTVPEEPADSILAWTLARLAAPSATPGSQTFVVGFDVTVSHNEADVTVRYTTDGSEPTESDSSVADGGTIAIGTATTTLKLKSFQNTGSLTSEVVTYEYTYEPPTEYVPEPDHRWTWYEHPFDAEDNYPRLSYAIAGLASCDLYNSENGGSSWVLLQSPTADGVFYTDVTEISSAWTPSDYRAYGEKVGYLDSNQLVVPDQCIPPLLWGQDPSTGTWNKRIGIQCFGTNCTINYRYATKSKSGGGWSTWSSWQTVSGKGWGDIIGTRFPNLSLESEFTDYEYEVYVSQSGFTDSVVMYINSDTRDIKYGGEGGTIINGFYSYKSSSYS